MKIAHVVVQRAETPRSGFALRTWALSTALARAGDLVIVNVGPGGAVAPASDVVTLGIGQRGRYEEVVPGDFAHWCATQDFDVVVAGEAYVAPWVTSVAAPLRIANCSNIESGLAREQAAREGSEEAAAHLQRARVFELIERTVLPQFDQVWVVSRSDADGLTALSPGSHIRVVPNVVAPPDQVERIPDPGHLVYFGSLWYGPNQQAVIELMRVSDELDRRVVPHRITVAGAGAPPWLVDEVSARPNAHAAGFVEDLAALLATASCAVFPSTYGGGTMLKLIEALAFSCPVVTTPSGARGVPELTDGEHAIIRPLGQRFVDAVAEVIAEPHRFDSVGGAGRSLVRDRYSVEVLSARVAELLGAFYG